MELWQRFTGRARRAVILAHEESLRTRAQRIGTDHLMLGVLGVGEGAAVEVLRRLDVDLDQLREDLRTRAESRPAEETTKEIAFTPEGQKVLQHAYNESRKLEQSYIGTEHLLVGLARERRGPAYGALRRAELNLTTVRRAARDWAATDSERAREELAQRGISELDRVRAQRRRPRASREEFGRAVTELAKEAHLDALVLVIGRDGLESCLSTQPRQLRELIDYLKRLLEEEEQRREGEGEAQE